MSKIDPSGHPELPRLYLREVDDPRKLPPSPWIGYMERDRKTIVSPASVVLRTIHHWHVVDVISLQDLTGYSRKTVRCALGKLIDAQQISNLGYLRGLDTKRNSQHFVPFRHGPRRPELPFFHPVRGGYVLDPQNVGGSGMGRLLKIGQVAIRFNTVMIPKVVAWIVGETGLTYRVVPLSEHILRRELGWYSEKKGETDAKETDQSKQRWLVKTAVPDAYLVSHRFAIRVVFESNRRSLEHYESIFRQTNHGDLIIFVVYQSTSLYIAIRNFVEDKKLPVCPIRWGNQEDLNTALRKVEEIRSDSKWLPSRYRSEIMRLYAVATLGHALPGPA